MVAAILAAQAGKSVTLLERSEQPGGATVGARLFPPHPARLSRYSYLIALLPAELIRRLGIDLRFASRSISSFTPVRRNGTAAGLLVAIPALIFYLYFVGRVDSLVMEIDHYGQEIVNLISFEALEDRRASRVSIPRRKAA